MIESFPGIDFEAAIDAYGVIRIVQHSFSCRPNDRLFVMVRQYL